MTRKQAESFLLSLRCLTNLRDSMKLARRILDIVLITMIAIAHCSCKNRNNNQESNETNTIEQSKEELFPKLPELSEPISTNLAYRSNTNITGYIQGWDERSKNLNATMVMNGDTTTLYRSRVMIVEDSHYVISESPVALYNEKGNIIFIPGRSSNCPYSYDLFADSNLIVDEAGIPGNFDFKLRNITQEQWKEILKNISPIRIRKDYPIKPVLYYDNGDEYNYAILFSADIRDKGIVCCGFNYKDIPDTEIGKYFKKVLLTYAYFYSQNSYKIPQELYCNLTEWLDIFDFEH